MYSDFWCSVCMYIALVTYCACAQAIQRAARGAHYLKTAMASCFSKLLLFLGLLLMFHAAYSAVQRKQYIYSALKESWPVYCALCVPCLDRSFLKLAEEEYTGLPSDVSEPYSMVYVPGVYPWDCIYVCGMYIVDWCGMCVCQCAAVCGRGLNGGEIQGH